ncbi:MAG: hypothetical protein HY092_01320 [Candidatus Kerfeldbacteria bacterium]|nr:hypothetical protein [Candidatus Kerfeldbacteria bacterium]
MSTTDTGFESPRLAPATPDQARLEVYQADQAARLAYAERGSYGEVLSRMFAEAENTPEAYSWTSNDSAFGHEVFSRDAEAFQEVLTRLYARLKESDAVDHLRHHQPESAHDIEAAYRAYDQALDQAMKKSTLSSKQEARLKFAAHSELDWSLRELVADHLLADEDAELRHQPKDFLLMLNPKIRKVDYMESGEILAVLRRSSSLASKDRLKADLKVLKSNDRAAAKEALNSFDQE